MANNFQISKSPYVDTGVKYTLCAWALSIDPLAGALTGIISTAIDKHLTGLSRLERVVLSVLPASLVTRSLIMMLGETVPLGQLHTVVFFCWLLHNLYHAHVFLKQLVFGCT